jgi:hypothetical protein
MEEIQKMIDDIKHEATDDERAHSDEDTLRKNFIAFVGERKDKLGEMARLVLTTDNIDFARWCA